MYVCNLPVFQPRWLEGKGGVKIFYVLIFYPLIHKASHSSYIMDREVYVAVVMSAVTWKIGKVLIFYGEEGGLRTVDISTHNREREDELEQTLSIMTLDLRTATV